MAVKTFGRIEHARFAMVAPQVAGLIVISVLLGGGGSKQGIFNAVVEALALLILAINGPLVARFVSNAPIALRALVLATLLLPLLQLIPLPPALWHVLPGQDAVQASLALIGEDGTWRPISVWPMRTAMAATGLIVPFCALVLALVLDGAMVQWPWRASGRDAPFVALVAMGLFGGLLGVAQLSTANSVGNIYGGSLITSQLYGTFANHNTAGIYFVVALIATLPLLPRKLGFSQRGLLVYASAAFFVLLVLLSQSRSAILVMFVALAMLAWRLADKRGLASWKQARGVLRGRASAYLAIAVVLLVTLAVGLNSTQRGSQIYHRYANLEQGDARTVIWGDGVETAQRLLPLGAGAGAFQNVFDLDESLETLNQGRAGRAHNELLEVAIEFGVLGLALLVGWGAYLLLRSVALFRHGEMSDRRFAAMVTLLCLGLQSFVDYPLRSQAGLCIAGVMVAILVQQRRRSAK